MLLRLTLSFALTGLPLLSAGCAGGATRSADRLDHEGVPRAYARAQELETEATRALAEANRREASARQREYYDQALALLREARGYYEEELVSDPGPPERQRVLEDELARLSDRIADIHRQRPLD